MLKFIRYFIYYLWFFLGSFLSALICLIRPFHPDNSRVAGKIIGLFPRWFLNIEVIYLNKSEFDAIEDSLIISNHQDNLDFVSIGAHIPHRTVSVGKKEIRYIPFFGQLFLLAGNILIDRGNRSKALKSLKKATDKLHQHKLNIWVMPEGTRSRGRGLLPFKKGAFYMAVNGNVKIAPVVVSSYQYLDLNRWKAGKIVIKKLPFIETSGKNPTELAKQSHQLMLDALKEVDLIAQS